MAKREFLMLAHVYNKRKHGVGGWYISEKLDGMRCFWDGGISTGLLKSEIPWANIAKDARYVTPQRCTGLWSRYGNVIHAPSWWTDALPKMPLDGELYGGIRQVLMSTVKALNPNDDAWQNVKYHCFDIPPFSEVFEDGVVNKRDIDVAEWFSTNRIVKKVLMTDRMNFETTYDHLCAALNGNLVAIAHKQTQLPFPTAEAETEVNRCLEQITESGGEGVMLRAPHSYWEHSRSHNLVKVKKYDDAEGTVIGYTTGRATDKGSKLLGLMGAMILRLDDGGATMELSGFTDAERILAPVDADNDERSASDWATQNPGVECPDWIEALYFPRGNKVTFRYRGKSRDGIPQEAHYWRAKINE